MLSDILAYVRASYHFALQYDTTHDTSVIASKPIIIYMIDANILHYNIS